MMSRKWLGLFLVLMTNLHGVAMGSPDSGNQTTGSGSAQEAVMLSLEYRPEPTDSSRGKSGPVVRVTLKNLTDTEIRYFGTQSTIGPYRNFFVLFAFDASGAKIELRPFKPLAGESGMVEVLKPHSEESFESPLSKDDMQAIRAFRDKPIVAAMVYHPPDTDTNILAWSNKIQVPRGQ